MFTPLGNQSKLLLTGLLAPTPSLLNHEDRYELPTYDWRLKDANWNFFSFEKSKGRIAFVSFWASWHLPSKASLERIQALHKRYGNQIDFYLVTDEERAPVLAFMERNQFHLPVTYRVVEDTVPFPTKDLGYTYIIDKSGQLILETSRVSDWTATSFNETLQALLQQ